MATEHVPRSALCFTAGQFELGDNGDDARSAPFKMVARSGQPIDHWYWGRIVHDLSGMRLSKQRVPIDYCHDDREVIGYANKFDSESGHLVVGGALTPWKENDRAAEIVHKQKAGVPYEASINFGGDGIVLERVPENMTVDVNGYKFAGPGVVVREWPLRGIAVCPYGADQNTSTTFSGASEIAVQIREADMPKAKPQHSLSEQDPQEEINQPEAEAQEESTAVEAEAVSDTAEAEEAQAEAVEAQPEAEQATEMSEGMRFLEAFGDRGGVWFAQGKTFAEAQQLFIDELVKERDALKAKLETLQGLGEDTPVKFSTADKKPKQKVFRIKE